MVAEPDVSFFCIFRGLWNPGYIHKTVNSNVKLNTKLTNHDKRDGARAKGCDYTMNREVNIEMTIGT